MRMTNPKVRSALRRQEGQALVLVLLSVAALIGFAALVVNVGHLVIAKVRLQNAADLTAFSAAAVQANAMNVIARKNMDMEDLVLRWRNDKKHYHFESRSDARREIRRRIDDHLEECLDAINPTEADRAMRVAAQVGTHNFPGSAVFQVGYQKVMWTGKLEPHPIVAKLAKGDTEVPLKYWVKKDGVYEDHTEDFRNPYTTLQSTAMFWARLQAPLPASPWAIDGVGEYLPNLTAESMAHPYNGHLGRVRGLGDLDHVSDTYEVKFGRINHPDITSYTPRQYYVYALTPSWGLTGEVVSESTRLSYAH